MVRKDLPLGIFFRRGAAPFDRVSHGRDLGYFSRLPPASGRIYQDLPAALRTAATAAAADSAHAAGFHSYGFSSDDDYRADGGACFHRSDADLTPATTTPVNVQQNMSQPVVSKPNTLSEARLSKIMDTEKSWGPDRQNILESNSDPKNITAKFPVYLASYANGDWGCNIHLDQDGHIDAGSLPDLVTKMNEWSHGHITGQVIPTPLNIGGPDLLEKKPPFIFFTGHKDFILTDQEVQNLSEYLQIGGCIWGDNALPGRGSRFDVAFRREMKRVVPDLDKNFEPVPMTADVFTKSWYPISVLPQGMNYYAEPIEHLDIDGKLAILYTPNDYSDLFFMSILPGDAGIRRIWPEKDVRHPNGSPLFTNYIFLANSKVFFRNFTLPSSLAAQQLGMNIIGYLLVRFDKDLLLTP